MGKVSLTGPDGEKPGTYGGLIKSGNPYYDLQSAEEDHASYLHLLLAVSLGESP